MYAMRGRIASDQAGPTECQWHSAMCDCVHNMGLAAYAHTGPAGAAGCSKPLTCWRLPSFHSCVCMHPSIRPCGTGPCKGGRVDSKKNARGVKPSRHVPYQKA